jgi:acyl-CoA synthetase (AMP-forming)/AMP-acid ligase II
MTLLEQALLNNNLLFIDDQSGKDFSLKELSALNFSVNNKKELVFAYIDNSIESISVFWSLMRGNYCIALLSPSITEHFKNELEQLYKPSIVYDKTRSEIINYELKSSHDVNYFNSIEDFDIDIQPQIKVLISTSGTTGSPKFVKLSEENLLSNANSICEYLPINSSDVTPLNLPVFYSYGLSVLTSNSLRGGKIVCTNDDVLKKDFWTSFQKYGYTSFAGVPFVYEMLDRIGFTKKEYPSLKYFTQAGGKLQDPLVKKYGEYAMQHQLKFYVMYGQTEATARMSYLSPNDTLNKIGSIGKPIPDGSFIIDEDTNELCYRGANIFGGYVQTSNDLSSYNQEEILRTGDIVKVDEDGFYFITGRLKRFTKLFGNRINLDEVESLVAKQFNGHVKCIGFNDSQLVIFTNEKEMELDTIAKFISSELKLHISVIKHKFVDEIPLTSNGKINYTELLNSYAAK